MRYLSMPELMALLDRLQSRGGNEEDLREVIRSYLLDELEFTDLRSETLGPRVLHLLDELSDPVALLDGAHTIRALLETPLGLTDLESGLELVGELNGVADVLDGYVSGVVSRTSLVSYVGATSWPQEAKERILGADAATMSRVSRTLRKGGQVQAILLLLGKS